MAPLTRATLLDLAAQRLRYIQRSPNWTREARHEAGRQLDRIEAERALPPPPVLNARRAARGR